MNKLLKYTSFLFLGFLMLATPEKAFAANEKVETDVDKFLSSSSVSKSNQELGGYKKDDTGLVKTFFDRADHLKDEFEKSFGDCKCGSLTAELGSKSIKAILGSNFSNYWHALGCTNSPDCNVSDEQKENIKRLGKELDEAAIVWRYMADQKGGELYYYCPDGKTCCPEGMKKEDFATMDCVLPVYLLVNSENGTIKSLSGVTRGCVPLQAKLAESRSCIFCPLFQTIFSTANQMATNSYKTLGVSLAKVLLIGFAILIAFKVMGNVSSFTKQDAPKFITELLINMFKVSIAFYMLYHSEVVYEYIIGPILKAGFEFGTSLLFHVNNSYLSSCKAVKLGGQAGVMPAYLYTNLDCFIKAVQAEIAVPQSIGSSLMCVAKNSGKTALGPIRNLLWDVGMMFQGLIIWIMGWIMALAFAFYLIDATVQLGILGALMPFLIVCWPFKITYGYTKKGWEIFMNTFFVYVFMGLVVSINVELLGQALNGAKGGFDEIMRALNGNDVKHLKDLLDIGFSGMLVLIACALFAFKLTGKTTDLASTMSGGGFNMGIGNRIGGLAANVATKATQGTTKLGMNTVGAIGDKTGATRLIKKGRDAVVDWALKKTIRRGRKSSAAVGTRSAIGAGVAGGAAVIPTSPASSDDIVAQSQVKKIGTSGPRRNPPVIPNPETPGSGGRAGETQQTHSESRTPQTEAQLRQQLENDYNNTENGKAGQQRIQNQTAEVSRKQKAETDAQNKMNHYNKRADEYTKKANAATNPVERRKFEDLANKQFEEAVKAEALYNKAKADTQRAQAELNAIQQENNRYKEQYVQTEMRKRSSNENRR